jgi:5-methylcytosine-specific restriction endonuclease McrA
MKKKKSTKQKITKKLDELWSLLVRDKCVCELCGHKGDIKEFDAHHIKKRGNLSTRWDLNNGVCLCKGCHRFKVHMDTFTVALLIDKLKNERGKEWYDELIKKTNQIVKYSIAELQELYDYYKGEVEKLDV